MVSAKYGIGLQNKTTLVFGFFGMHLRGVRGSNRGFVR